ncbi:MAG: hypothetical protein C0601_01565 [Candidatus Muiribacterium halophilum]|uniref:Uncharacterized protein n=1 Tax=Muiribacterium halophilum TaxID=2053465 RepID=A0A2N5ZLL4_MUIH1|nr:MAG: hypothetical protein C0601_01565 [Candidatus Muirbacterium halophilum]
MKRLFNISHSQKQLLQETSFILDRSVESIINEFQDLYNDNLNSSNKKANTQKLIEWVFTLRYPEYSKAVELFENLKKQLSKKNIELKYDRSFENEDYHININFSDIKDLESSISVIQNNLKDLKEELEYIRP